MINLTGNNQIHITDALNVSMLKLKLKKGSNTLSPNDNEIVVYVDKNSSSNPTSLRRQYVFPIVEPLKSCIVNNEQYSDEFILKLAIEENDVVRKTYVNRIVGEQNTLLTNPYEEEVDNSEIVLFEGENYIYTNYENIDIELTYLENTEANIMMLNSAVYYNHRVNNSGEFSLDDIYFKDAFTKSGNQLNLEVDNANIKCLSSKNNAFSLDEQGNLVVNSISSNSINITASDILDIIYPIGSIYLSINDVNPSTIFGGSWEKIKDKFLLCSGDTYVNGNTGGSPYLQSHSHSIPSLSGSTDYNGTHSHVTSRRTSTYGAGVQTYWRAITAPDSANGDYNQISYTENSGNHNHSVTTNANNTGNTGSGSAENMPPYLVICAWKRTA